MRGSGATGPLAGVRVLELANLYAGPSIGAMLGDLGADVVKVEPPDGDELRRIAARSGGRPGTWDLVTRNKRLIELDHRSPAGRQLLARLTSVADVVLLNQPRALLEEWGCSPEEIAGRNPGAVVVMVSGWGTDGPYVGRPSNGTIAEAFSGVTAHLTGPDGSPHAQPLLLGDTFTALVGALGAVSALVARDRRDGKGQIVDVAGYEALLPVLAPLLIAQRDERGGGRDEREGGRDARAGGGEPARSQGSGLRAALRTSDARWLMVTAYSDAQITRLLETVGIAVDPEAASHQLVAVVTAWVAENDAATVLAALERARIQVAPINDLPAMIADAHVAARGSLVAVDHPDHGRLLLPAPVPRFSATPSAIRSIGGDIGRDGAAVLADWLGAPDDTSR